MSKYQALIDALAGVDGQLGQPSLHSGHVIYAETEEWCSVDINVKLSANKHISGPLARFIKESANPSTIRALLVDLERAEKDAARYRFLAAHCQSTSEHWGGRWSIVVEGPAPKTHDSEDEFDAAIDAALAQMAGG